LIDLINLRSGFDPAILKGEIMIDINGTLHQSVGVDCNKKTKIIMPVLGTINDIPDLNSIYLSPFHTLLRLYSKNPTIVLRKIIVNNFETGLILQEYFRKWKKR